MPQQAPIEGLPALQDWLRTLSVGSTIALDPGLFAAGPVESLLAMLPRDEAPTLEITEADAVQGVLAGSLALFGVAGGAASFRFSAPNGVLLCDSTLTAAAGVSWSLIPGFSLAFTNLSIDLTVDPVSRIVSPNIACTLTAGAGETLNVRLSVPTAGGDWMLLADVPQAKPVGSDALHALAGSNGIAHILPADLADLSKLKLTGFEAAFDPVAGTCSLARIGLAYDGDWSFFDGQFSVDELDLTLELIDGAFGAKLIAKMTVGAPIEIGGQFPDKALFARLPPGTDLEVGKVFDFFHVPLTLSDALKISRLDFVFFTEHGSYSFVTQINTPVPIAGDVALDNFLFAVDAVWDETLKKPKASGRIASSFSFGAATTLALTGTYGADGGLTLAGTAEHVNMGALAASLAETFKVDVPGALAEAQLDKIDMSFDSAGRRFGFSCTGSFAFSGTTAVFNPVIALTWDDGGTFKGEFDATLVLSAASGKTLTFSVTFADEGGKSSFTAQFAEAGGVLEFGDIAHCFGFDLPAIPEGLDLALTNAAFTWNAGDQTLILAGASRTYGNAVFVRIGGAIPQYYFLLDLGRRLSLSDLPLVGPELARIGDIGISKLHVIACSSPQAAQKDAAQVDALIQTLHSPDGSAWPSLPAATLPGKLVISAELDGGGQAFPLHLALAGAATAPVPALAASANGPAAAPPPAATGLWFDVARTFGPVTVQRIGVQYDSGTLFFLLDASLGIGTISLGLSGLGIGSKLTALDPIPHLDGVSLGFSSGPVTISGGLLVVPPRELPAGVLEEYAGEVVVSAPPYTITAAASYAKLQSQPSVFVFANPQGNFGGPPSFFVTGLLAGFGYNSSLSLPAPDQVHSFPFLAGLDDPATFGANATPMQVLSVLQGSGGNAWVSPAPGSQWLAAGVTFRSFELVLGSALIAVRFGKEFEAALLGLAHMRLPKEESEPAYAYVELQIEAALKPDEGTFSIIGSLTPDSYLLTRDCHLTGGFCFAVWFGDNPHAGDFVVSIGGYHPAFQPPRWYPQPARVGFNWVMGGDVTIKGGAYFALTPTAAMAGGSLEVLFESGDLRAWCTAYANAMIRWKPFYLTADVGISIGASYRLNLLFTHVTVSVELGATLTLWGPPTGGVAHIHWSIISFSISFGADQRSAAAMTVGWGDMRTLLPPAATSAAGDSGILKIHVVRGLSGRDESIGAAIVRADELMLATRSAIPISALTVAANPVAIPPAWANGIDIRPMGLNAVASTHAITLASLTDAAGADADLSRWTVSLQTADLPEALWGVKLNDGDSPAPAAATVAGLVVGATLVPPAAAIVGQPVGPLDPAQIVFPLGTGTFGLDPADRLDPIGAPSADAGLMAQIAGLAGATGALAAQSGIADALAALGAAPPTRAPLLNLAAAANDLFSESPLRGDQAAQ